MGLGKRLRIALHLLIVGTTLSKLHAVSYVVSCLSTVMWFLVIFVPVTLFSPNPIAAFKTFLPGVLAMGAASVGMWVATEFTRWYVYQGLTDLFRECGLGVLHYLFCSIHIDLLLANTATFFASALAVSWALTGSPTLAIPSNPWLLALAVASSIPTYLLCGSLTALLYCKTGASGTWTNVLQILVTVGTVVPPTALPKPELAFVNPAAIVAEIARAAYGAPSIPLSELLPLTPIAIATQLALALYVSKLVDEEIARHGLEFRV